MGACQWQEQTSFVIKAAASPAADRQADRLRRNAADLIII
jgi:hypothetical protein